jgi:hypothetical protein
MSHIDNNFFHSSLGYSTPLTPKRLSAYDISERRMIKKDNYSLEDMIAVESQVVWLTKTLSKRKWATIFDFGQVKNGDRSALIYFKDSNPDYSANNFVTFQLQSGVIYNMPIARMRAVTGLKLTRMHPHDIATGIPAKKFISIMDKYFAHLESKASRLGFYLNDDLKRLAVIALNNKVVYDLKTWNEFLSAGVSVRETAFALSKSINPQWQSGKLNVTPETAKGLKDMPFEWVTNLLL